MANFGLLGLFGRSALARPGDIQRGPATREDRGQLWQEPEDSRFQVNEPPPAASPSPFDDPLVKAQYRPAGLLSPADEAQFQTFMAFDPSVRAWRNSFQNRYGEQPNTVNDPTYDYRAAWAAGNRPQPVPGDTVPHWGSEGKAPDHPTEWKQQFMTRFGIDPDALQPHQVTPEMQQFFTTLLAPAGLLGKSY